MSPPLFRLGHLDHRGVMSFPSGVPDGAPTEVDLLVNTDKTFVL